MTIRRTMMHRARSLFGVLVLAGIAPAGAGAQEAGTQPSPHHGQAEDRKAPASDLVKVVREATARFP